ncbi:mechanosensitive ion channel protein 1, mitochondrial [Gossypium australe]|uniref:Mechanosensitive ion channel protein 1, mitochondrial n=1 Tax=Gossypium australe TaxID=47621 RepID=A0A5B6UXD9_9ROSI|nr:mechanosensitive ion channel protein 1, mitochondrial [Gossypium australe]
MDRKARFNYQQKCKHRKVSGFINDPLKRQVSGKPPFPPSIDLLFFFGSFTSKIPSKATVKGVATAFAARDIFGNVLSGLYMQFSKPFSLGDTIKAGSIEGQVVEMGLTSTTVLNSERFPVLVPNSLFSSQVIVNKSRARWRAVVTKIPLQIEDLDKVPEISNAIKSMLKSNSKVFLGKEVPYCFLSHVEGSYAELTVGCNLRHMSKDELYSTQQDILLQSVRIIKKHGATLGSTFQCPIGQ